MIYVHLVNSMQKWFNSCHICDILWYSDALPGNCMSEEERVMLSVNIINIHAQQGVKMGSQEEKILSLCIKHRQI